MNERMVDRLRVVEGGLTSPKESHALGLHVRGMAGKFDTTDEVRLELEAGDEEPEGGFSAMITTDLALLLVASETTNGALSVAAPIVADGRAKGQIASRDLFRIWAAFTQMLDQVQLEIDHNEYEECDAWIIHQVRSAAPEIRKRLKSGTFDQAKEN